MNRMKNEPAATTSTIAFTDAACEQGGDVAAYLDGELDAPSVQLFEEHIAVCSVCRECLAEQRRMLAALDGAFNSRDEVELPQEFAQKVTARARTDMNGVRSRGERRRALQLCLLLTISTLLLLGGAAGAMTLGQAGSMWRSLISIINLASQTAGDLSTGVVVLMRALSGSVTNESSVAPFLLCGVFFLSLLLLLRLIGAYRSGEQTS